MALPPELQSALLGRSVIFLRGRLDDAAASNTIAQLLLVSRTAAPDTIIDLYIDSPKGEIGAALAVYDTIQTLGTRVSTTGMSTVGGASVLVLAGGSPGRRFALPHARINLSEAEFEPPPSASRDPASHAAEVSRQRARWQECLAKHVAHSVDRIGRDLAAGRWLSTAEARDYGIVDGIIPGVPA
jgi:ATP-dependent Clp protease protease subunit